MFEKPKNDEKKRDNPAKQEDLAKRGERQFSMSPAELDRHAAMLNRQAILGEQKGKGEPGKEETPLTTDADRKQMAAALEKERRERGR